MPHHAPSRDVPRLLPDVPLPPYGYVSGQFPHPTGDPAGHMAGQALPRPAPPDPQHWRECHDYLRGLDLFNYGYYWEAHEVWEGLWHAVGRSGLLGGFLKGLIKLAAAGVKARERRPEGVRRHARRSSELFAMTAVRLEKNANSGVPRLLGLDVDQLTRQAKLIADTPPRVDQLATLPAVEIVFDFQLVPT